MAGRSSLWRRWLTRGGLLIVVPLLVGVAVVGYFFAAGAQQRHEVAMPPPGLPDVAGDQNGRLLPASDSGPAAQFMYEAESGERLTLYVEQNLAGGATAFRFTEYDEVSAFRRKDGPLAYVLIGRGERDRLLGLARATYQELNP